MKYFNKILQLFPERDTSSANGNAYLNFTPKSLEQSWAKDTETTTKIDINN